MCWRGAPEICGEPSTEYCLRQPQYSAHGQRLREHCPRFPCRGILQCWRSPYEMSDEKTGSLVHTFYPIHTGMSRVFYLPHHRTLSARHPTIQIFISRFDSTPTFELTTVWMFKLVRHFTKVDPKDAIESTGHQSSKFYIKSISWPNFKLTKSSNDARI